MSLKLVPNVNNRSYKRAPIGVLLLICLLYAVCVGLAVDGDVIPIFTKDTFVGVVGVIGVVGVEGVGVVWVIGVGVIGVVVFAVFVVAVIVIFFVRAVVVPVVC